MLVVSSREFRDNQKSYLDKVDEGLEILIQREKNKSYKIVPITDNDTVINKNYILTPDEDFSRAISMEEFTAEAKEHIRQLYRQGKKWKYYFFM